MKKWLIKETYTDSTLEEHESEKEANDALESIEDEQKESGHFLVGALTVEVKYECDFCGEELPEDSDFCSAECAEGYKYDNE